MICSCLKHAAKLCFDEISDECTCLHCEVSRSLAARILALPCACSEKRYAELLAHAEAMAFELSALQDTSLPAEFKKMISESCNAYEQWKDRQ